jgi:hypothetical protein
MNLLEIKKFILNNKNIIITNILNKKFYDKAVSIIKIIYNYVINIKEKFITSFTIKTSTGEVIIKQSVKDFFMNNCNYFYFNVIKNKNTVIGVFISFLLMILIWNYIEITKLKSNVINLQKEVKQISNSQDEFDKALHFQGSDFTAPPPQ